MFAVECVAAACVERVERVTTNVVRDMDLPAESSRHEMSGGCPALSGSGRAWTSLVLRRVASA